MQVNQATKPQLMEVLATLGDGFDQEIGHYYSVISAHPAFANADCIVVLDLEQGDPMLDRESATKQELIENYSTSKGYYGLTLYSDYRDPKQWVMFTLYFAGCEAASAICVDLLMPQKAPQPS